MTAYEMRISDWSSDVCSSDLDAPSTTPAVPSVEFTTSVGASATLRAAEHDDEGGDPSEDQDHPADERRGHQWPEDRVVVVILELLPSIRASVGCDIEQLEDRGRSEEHTSELQSLMRISYAVFCLKKK